MFCLDLKRKLQQKFSSKDELQSSLKFSNAILPWYYLVEKKKLAKLYI